MPDAEEWPLIEKLKYEKEVIGIYLTGHPLDNYKLEMDKYCNTTIAELKNMQKARSGEGGDDVMAAFAQLKKRGEVCVGGLVGNVQHKMTKTGVGRLQ
jgi:DNA polymerase-3 subunit alpha